MLITPIVQDINVPPDEVWFITPGDSIEVVNWDGTTRRVWLKPPRIYKMINVGQKE